VQTLKDSILESPALRHLDYECNREVILAVDTSVVAVGFILLQLGEDGKRYPNCFGSIMLGKVKSRYSQAKLELYGLFCALHAVRIYIFGITNLTVEVDTKYIKNMINNPDLQPNTTINRWIAGILLFQFKLVHVPAKKHAGIDGLSRRPPAENDPEEDDHEDWVDHAYSFGVVFEELLCRWGPITKIVTDNVPAYRLAVDVLAAKYGVHPICVSPYNSQANGIVKRRHHDVWEAIMKTCKGDDLRWYQVAHSVFWAEHVTVQKAMGLSPYFMVHGVEPIFPFDLAEVTFLVSLPERGAFMTTDIIAWHARQLQKRTKDLTTIKEKVLKAHYSSIHNFEKRFCASIKDYNFAPGALVLV
jgi:hypothetical protein